MIDANMVPVKIWNSNSSLPDKGIRINQFVDAASLVKFRFQLDLASVGIDPATGDEAELVCENGDVVVLTRNGDYWDWDLQPDDLRAPAIAPGSSQKLKCQIVFTRTASNDPVANQPKRVATDFFNVQVNRQVGFSPDKIAGLVAWYDAYDFISTTSGTAVAQWNDKSAFKRHLTQSTGANQPTVGFDGAGRPFLLFDGTNDQLETAWVQFGLASTIVCAFQIDTSDPGARGVVQVGGTNGARLAFTSAAVRGISGSDTASTGYATLDTTIVGTVTKAASGNVSVQVSTSQSALGSATSQASTAAVTPDSIQVGDTDADTAANVRIHELAVFSSVVGANDLARIQRALLMKWTGQ
jgi:hypothetical protein